jgi:hypothetical protein
MSITVNEDGQFLDETDDFCLEHGRDFMRCDKGPIPYCRACEREKKPHSKDCLVRVVVGASCQYPDCDC